MKQSCNSNYTQVLMKKISYSVIQLFRYSFSYETINQSVTF